jgi:membrane protein
VRRLVILTVRSLQKFGEDRCSTMAAAISYYALFSLFPLVIFMVSIFGIFLESGSLKKDLIDKVLEFLPLTSDKGKTDVQNALDAVAGVSIHLSIIGLLGLAWSASGMFGTIRNSLDVVWKLETSRPLIRQKLVDFSLMAGVGVFFLLSIGTTALLHATQLASSDILGPLSGSSALVWRTVPHVVPAMFSFVAFLVLYRLVPHARTRVADVWPGALVATVFFEVVKNGFSLYVANFGRYDVIYGSLGAVVALLFWMYLSAVALLIGAEVACEYPRVTSGKYDDLWRRGWLLGGARAKLSDLRQKLRLRLGNKKHAGH